MKETCGSTDLDEGKVLLIVNKAREKYNLKPLKIDEKLEKTAENRVADMKEKQYFSHKNDQGQGLKYFLDNEGYDYLKAGEVLAVNYRNEESLVESWMKSPAHKKVLLGASYTEFGISIGKITINNKENIATSLIIGQKKQ